MTAVDQNRIKRSLEAFVGLVFTDGNRVTRLRNGREIFPAMLQAVRAAQHRIDFVTFVYWKGEIAKEMAAAVAERAEAGVEIRILLDDVGARLMPEDLTHQMRSAGANVTWFRPITRWKVWESDHRTHRKILVVDDEVAFTGGVGIAEEWEGDASDPSEWRDSHFEIRGPAVDPLRAVFLADWRDTGNDLFSNEHLPEKPAAAGSVSLGVVDASAMIELNAAARMFETMAKTVASRLWLSTPYFNPTPRMAELLVEAVGRGVDVRVMIPGDNIDKQLSRIMAEDMAIPLIDAGVAVYRFLPTMLHLKQLVADDDVVAFGSVNLNARSMMKDEEVVVVAIDRDLNSVLAGDFEDDLERSERLADSRPLRRALKERLISKALRPLRSEF